jgi:Sec7-like guanine-nucleotide exchange factor
MLNTDLHTPLNRRKITKSEFIRNSRNVQACAELSEVYLGHLYDEILKNQLMTSLSSKQTEITGNDILERKQVLYAHSVR